MPSPILCCVLVIIIILILCRNKYTRKTLVASDNSPGALTNLVIKQYGPIIGGNSQFEENVKLAEGIIPPNIVGASFRSCMTGNNYQQFTNCVEQDFNNYQFDKTHHVVKGPLNGLCRLLPENKYNKCVKNFMLFLNEISK